MVGRETYLRSVPFWNKKDLTEISLTAFCVFAELFAGANSPKNKWRNLLLHKYYKDRIPLLGSASISPIERVTAYR